MWTEERVDTLEQIQAQHTAAEDTDNLIGRIEGIGVRHDDHCSLGSESGQALPSSLTEQFHRV
jgi:hypothetical protein